jgi:hypothetical protein
VHLVADEGVEKAVVDRLRGEGHQVDYVAELAPSMRDEAVLTMANEKKALLITREARPFWLMGRPGL